MADLELARLRVIAEWLKTAPPGILGAAVEVDEPNPDIQTRYLLVTIPDVAGAEADEIATQIEEVRGSWTLFASYLPARYAEAWKLEQDGGVSPIECGHLQGRSTDGLPSGDPEKVYRCDRCGWTLIGRKP